MFRPAVGTDAPTFMIRVGKVEMEGKIGGSGLLSWSADASGVRAPELYAAGTIGVRAGNVALLACSATVLMAAGMIVAADVIVHVIKKGVQAVFVLGGAFGGKSVWRSSDGVLEVPGSEDV